MNGQSLLAILLAFASVKTLFAAIGWYTEDFEDKRVRRTLDELHDVLDAIPFRELAFRFLSHFVRRWESTFATGWRAVTRFLVLSFVYNSVLFSFGFFFPAMSLLGWDHFHAVWLFNILYYAFFGLIPDAISSYASLWLLKHAISRKRLQGLIAICIMDILLLCAAFFANWYILYSISTRELLPLDFFFEDGFFFRIISFPQNPLVLPFSVAGASFQTFLYLILGLFFLIVRLVPRWVQRFATRCVYKLTTSKSAVFSQLGNGVGALAAVLTALLQVLKAR